MAIDPQVAAQMAAPEDAAMGAGSTEPMPGTTSEAEDIWGRVSGLDAEELMQRHPELKRRLDGRVGTLAEQRANQLAQQQLAAREPQLRAQAREEAMREQEERSLREARDTDPYRHAELSKQIESQRLQRQSEDASRRAQEAPFVAAQHAAMAYDRQVLDHFMNQLPEADRQRLIADRGHVWQASGDAYAARRTMIDDVMVAVREHDRKEWDQAQKAQAQRNSAMAAAERSDLLAEQSAGSSVDTGSGMPPSALPSLDDWGRMSITQHNEWKKRDPNILSKIGQQHALQNPG